MEFDDIDRSIFLIGKPPSPGISCSTALWTNCPCLGRLCVKRALSCIVIVEEGGKRKQSPLKDNTALLARSTVSLYFALYPHLFLSIL